MAVSVQYVLNVTSMAGGACAIGLPVALHSINVYENTRKVSLTYCDTNEHENLPSIAFGDKTTKDVCGVIQPDNKNSKIETVNEEYSNLFRNKGEQGAEKDQEGNFGAESKGSQQCEKSQQKGGITSVETGAEYFGLCSTSEIQSTPFVKKKKDDSGEKKMLKLQICDNNCGDTTTTELQGIKFWQKERKDNGKDVVFKRTR